MAASVQFRPHNRDLGMVMREVDEDLAIFLGMRPSSEKERMNDFNDSNEAKSDSSLILKASEPETVSAVETDDNFVKLDVERNDYDWLLSQADASLLPSEEIDSAINHYQVSNGDGVPLKSEVDSTVEEFASRSDSSMQLHVTASADSSAPENRRPPSSDDRKPARRSATPTGRPTLREKPKPSCSSTPTPRATFPSSKPMAAPQSRSSTPGRSMLRSSAPAYKPGQTVLPSSKSAARSATPTRTPLTQSRQTLPGRTTTAAVVKNPVSSCGISSTAKSKPSKPSEILSLSHDSSQNLKLAMVKRPASASRGRPAAQAITSASSNGKPRQKSCSPAKVRAPTTATNKPGNKILVSKSRGLCGDGDEVNPILVGTKMVNRVVNMRKLAPPKQDECMPHGNERKSSHENSGFGRSLSKSSLDMAIRHMDVGRSIGDNIHPVAVASRGLSSGRGNRPGTSKNGTISVLESPPLSRCDSSKSGSSYLNSRFPNGAELDY